MSASSAVHTTIPKIIIAVLVLLSIMPLGLGKLALIYPSVEAICVIYWSVYRPRVMPYWFAFLLGLCWDAIYGWPLGITAFGCVMLRFLVVFYRSYFHTGMFPALWQSVAFTLAAYTIYAWLALSMVYNSALPVDVAMIQWAFTVAVYPLFHGVFNLVSVIMPERYSDA